MGIWASKQQQAETPIEYKHRTVSKVVPFRFNIRIEQYNAPPGSLFHKTIEFNFAESLLLYRQHVKTEHNAKKPIPSMLKKTLPYQEIVSIMNLMEKRELPNEEKTFDYNNLHRVVRCSKLELNINHEGWNKKALFLWNDGDNERRAKEETLAIETEKVIVDEDTYKKIASRGELADLPEYQQAKRIILALAGICSLNMQGLLR